MIATPDQPHAPERPTVWGLRPHQMHDRFWAARGIQVVRQGEASEIVEDAELFLLIDPRSLLVFKVRSLIETLSWLRPRVLMVRVRDGRERGYREVALTDARGQFRGFRRLYGGSDPRLARAALTPDPDVAKIWQSAPSPGEGWRRLRREIPRRRRAIASVTGSVYDTDDDREVMEFLRELVQCWQQPSATIRRARRVASGVWVDREAEVDPAARFVGPAWVGARRRVPSETSIVGPALLWDDPRASAAPDDVDWEELEPTPSFLDREVKLRQRSWLGRTGKRLFDIVVALGMLAVTVPFYPLIMLAIWLEDGRPFFFAHMRETVGGREFPCIKFRSMRNDAERIKAELMRKNQADGPQFFIEDDPRILRVGRFLRKFNIDELPQFWNVLMGDMSVVGPRPSPHKENQFCPPWREARLSVKPGITGLWQVQRTRRQGMDFQEWIKYDIEYVENQNWRLDLWILWKTALLFIR